MLSKQVIKLRKVRNKNLNFRTNIQVHFDHWSIMVGQ